MTVLGVRLAGHGTRSSDLKGKNYRHWIDSVVTALAKLKEKCAKVYLIGLSMGGTLSLHLASGEQADGIVVICAPVYLDLRLYLKRPLKYLFGFKNEVDRNIKDPVARKNHITYSRVPLGAIIQLFALMSLARSELERITVPVLMFQAKEDRVVPAGNGPYIYDRLVNSVQKDLIWLSNSGHIATIDCDKTIIMSKTRDFIERQGKEK